MLTTGEIAAEHLPTSGRISDVTWLSEWSSIQAVSPTDPQVPLRARTVHTPLLHSSWASALHNHHCQPIAEFFLSGIAQGFRVGYNYAKGPLKSAPKNLNCALQHMEVVDEYLQNELTHNRISGPFRKDETSRVHISRFGVIPKNHQQDKWRLIVDLSFPKDQSVNDGVPKSLCSLSYITVDDAIEEICRLGPGCLLAKIDIKNAFRLLPVHPADRHLLGMEWRDAIYIDNCLPFGLRSAPRLFDILAELLSWIVYSRGVSFSIHYLDDFLTVGPSASPTCQKNLEIFKNVCKELGVPLALEKVDGPTTCLTFLGITLDTHKMEIRLPEDKLARTKIQISSWLQKKSATKRQILSLVGLLQHATKVVRHGRTFVARMYKVAAKVKELSYYTRLNAEFKSDLFWWYYFLEHWNGLSLLRSTSGGQPADLCIQTDASGTWGCGAAGEKQWFQWPWPKEWSAVGIMAKELVPIVISCAVWGPHMSKRKVLFQCDNMSVVSAVQKGSAKEPVVMHLLRSLWFFVAFFDIDLNIEHIAGVNNCAADMLSRNNMSEFLLSFPQVSRFPTALPQPLFQILSPQELDWTSPAFGRLFKSTINMVQPHPLRTPMLQASVAM